MTGYGFIRSLRIVLSLGLVVVAAVLGFAGFIFHELSTEARFRSTYGAHWQSEYETVYGSLTKARIQIVLSVAGILTIVLILMWLRKILGLGRASGTRGGGRGKRHRHHYGSNLERIIRYRRNALVGIYFGLVGIVAGVSLVIFRLGIFADHSNETVLGIVVFCCGYFTVLTGCSWWLKAKGWNEALVFIGLMPLAIIGVPFVRLILLVSPVILPLGMIMMLLILIVIVLVLPDRSGASHKRWWHGG